jgi:hypothetical protein
MAGSTFIESKNNPKNNSINKNKKASDCKKVKNGLTNLTNSIENCTSEIEKNRNNKFAENTVKLEEDISLLRATTNDALIMGDTMFGQAGYSDIAKQVQERNNDLKNKKESLLKEIGKGEEIIARSNRDFADVHDTITEPQPQKTLRFIEDYTLAILTLSYLFMIIAAIYIYTVTSEIKLVAFGKAFVGSILLSMFLFIFLFYIT